MALRVYLECNLDDRNAIYLLLRGLLSMSNPFDQYSPEILAGWFARVSSSERWEMEKEDFWQCCASDQSGCKGCNWFQDNNCEASFNEECPQVIAEFNLDEKQFN
jgi:hypothetical protein